MSKNKSINSTLLKNLFVTPKPIYLKQYKEIRRYAFPNENHFISFLTTEDFDKKVEYGELILQSLCYSSNFFPPSVLFKNLYSLEKFESAKPHDNFVGRDHFIHLVYLYLLGIYLFFYFPVLNKKLSASLECRRRNFRKSLDSSSPLNPILSTSYDFLTIWKQFVLIHDLGYPFELAFYQDSSLSSLPKETRFFIYNFKELKEEILRDLSLKTLSRIISMFHVCHPSEDETFQTMVLDNILRCFSWDQENKSWIEVLPDETFLSDWHDAPFVEKAITDNCIKSLTSVVSWTSLVAVLFHNDYENPILAINPGDGGRNNNIIYCKKVDARIRGENHLVNAFIEGKSPSKDYFWRYYCADPEYELKLSLNSILEDNLIDGLKEAHLKIVRHIPHEISMMDDESDFVNFGFHTMKYFSDIFGEFRYDLTDHNDDTILDFAVNNPFFSMKDEAIKLYCDEIGTKIAKSFDGDEDIFLEWANFFLSNEPISTDLINVFKSKIKLSNTSHLSLLDKIKNLSTEKINFIITIYNSWIKIKNSLSNISEYEELFNFNSVPVSLNQDKVDTLSSTFDFQSRFSKNNSDQFSDILNTYCSALISQGNTENNKLDHGVVSSLVLLELSQIFSHYGNKLFNIWQKRQRFDGQQCLLNLTFNAQNHPRGGNLLYQSKELLFEPIFASLIHNIGGFPINGKPKAIKIEKEPFAYLAVLADELQNWGRPQTTNMLSGRRRDHTASQDFDIQISNNRIIISENNIESDIQDREQSLKIKLGKKLDRVDNYIRLHLKQK